MSGARTLDHLATDPTYGEDSIPHDRTLRPPLSTGSLAPSALPTLPIADLHGDDVDLVLGKTLGEGGMGVVFLAHQVSLDRDVVVKRVRPGAPPRAAEALLREARIAGGLEHPNIVPVHALGRDADGVPALVMKRIEGRAWTELIREREAPLSRHLEILGQVCQAVAYAHDRGVLHRDLKPDNVMIGRFGEVYVVDWGVAERLGPDARTEAVAGTPAYMASEMLAPGAAIGPFTDVYLLGGCLHHVLTGLPPHRGDSLDDVFASVQASAPADYGDEIPGELAAIAHRALAGDPTRRFASAGELREALAWYLKHEVSIALAAAARSRLSELRALTATPGVAPVARIEELFSEARFGFRQALEASDNAAAAADLAQLVECMIRWKLENGDLGGAEGLLPQLPGDASQLRADLARRRADQAAAHDLRHQLDPTVGANRRLGSIAGMLVFFVAVTGALLVASGGHVEAYDHRTAFVVAAVSGAAILGGMALIQRRIAATQFNRAIFGSAAISVVAICANRALDWRLDVPVAAMMAADLLFIGVILVAMMGLVAPRLRGAAVPFGVGAFLIALSPSEAMPIFGVAALLGIASFFAIGWWSWRDRPA